LYMDRIQLQIFYTIDDRSTNKQEGLSEGWMLSS
jgi:hypothetical protein